MSAFFSSCAIQPWENGSSFTAAQQLCCCTIARMDSSCTPFILHQSRCDLEETATGTRAQSNPSLCWTHAQSNPPARSARNIGVHVWFRLHDTFFFVFVLAPFFCSKLISVPQPSINTPPFYLQNHKICVVVRGCGVVVPAVRRAGPCCAGLVIHTAGSTRRPVARSRVRVVLIRSRAWRQIASSAWIIFSFLLLSFLACPKLSVVCSHITSWLGVARSSCLSVDLKAAVEVSPTVSSSSRGEIDSENYVPGTSKVV